MFAARSRGDGWPANAVESIATRDEIAGELVRCAILPKSDAWLVGIEVARGDPFDTEADVAAGAEARGARAIGIDFATDMI